MKLDPIATGRRTLADETYQRITAAMLSGALAPGSRLLMDALAEELTISRSPVRDALRRLEQEGLIARTGGRGFVVREIEPEEVRQIYQAREAIEGYAARLAAENGQIATNQVRRAITEARGLDLKTPQGSYLANQLVHRAIVEASGNRILLELFDDLWGRGRAYQIYASCFQGEDSHAALQGKHQPVIVALERSDGEGAEAALLAHLREGLAQHHLATEPSPGDHH